MLMGPFANGHFLYIKCVPDSPAWHTIAQFHVANANEITMTDIQRNQFTMRDVKISENIFPKRCQTCQPIPVEHAAIHTYLYITYI